MLDREVSDLNDPVDHNRGARSAHLIVEFGDYECPYSRLARRQVQQLEDQLDGEARFDCQYFPLTDSHPVTEEAA
jgi:protein-disulfide isomerase